MRLNALNSWSLNSSRTDFIPCLKAGVAALQSVAIEILAYEYDLARSILANSPLAREIAIEHAVHTLHAKLTRLAR